MLTADLLPVRRKNGLLTLPAIDGKSKTLHLELAEQVVAVVSECDGMTREQLMAELGTVAQSPTEARIVKGYAKLVEDSVEFEEDRGRGAQAKREAIFESAADAWKRLEEHETFDRVGVLDAVAAGFDLRPEELEDELFVDLPGAQRVTKTVSWTAEELLSRYDEERIMALLLRAVKVTARFCVTSPVQVRDLFRVLKFRRLLFELSALEEGWYELTLTGPYSLFDSVTKYGLKLALCWPVLKLQPKLEMTAELRWGKKNERCEFHWSSKVVKARRGTAVATTERAENPGVAPAAHEESDELAELTATLEKSLPAVEVKPAGVMLDLPGVGLCVPDLSCRFTDGRCVHVELMGYWSRAAVFKRVELVEAGLVEPVLFVVSSRLRVSEEVLDDQSNGALYVYRGRINASTLASKVNALADRSSGKRLGAKARRSK